MANPDPTSIAALAIASAALALEVRRWFEAKPRLRLSVQRETETFGGPQSDDSVYLAIRAINHGQSPTMITQVGLLEFATPIHAFFRLRGKVAIIPNPAVFGTPYRLPYKVGTHEDWLGVCRHTKELEANWLSTKRGYVYLIASHRRRSYVKRIPKPQKLPNPVHE